MYSYFLNTCMLSLFQKIISPIFRNRKQAVTVITSPDATDENASWLFSLAVDCFLLREELWYLRAVEIAGREQLIYSLSVLCVLLLQTPGCLWGAVGHKQAVVRSHPCWWRAAQGLHPPAGLGECC